jgi:hypothetical protein
VPVEEEVRGWVLEGEVEGWVGDMVMVVVGVLGWRI